MKNTIIYLLIVLFPVATKAQDAIYEKSDSILIEEIIKRHTLDSYRSTGELAIAIAEEFEGMEYVANTLDNTKKEHLFISCDKLDCTTFVELVAAMTITVCNNENKFADVCKFLETFGEMRALGKVCIEVVSYNPMTLFLSGVSVEYLNLDTRQVIGNYVAGAEYSFRREVVCLLHRVGPFALVAEWELFYLFWMYVP